MAATSRRRGASTSRGQPEERRQRAILRAAVEVFARKGYHGCRIADVAREAGVAYGLVYHYYRNKDALLETVFRAGWGSFVGRLRAAAEPERPLGDGLRAVSRVVFDAWRDEPRAVRVLILEIARSPGGRINRQSLLSESMALARGLFERAKARGELRAEADPQLCAALLFGALEMGMTACVLGLIDVGDDAQLDRACEQVAATFLNGVLAT